MTSPASINRRALSYYDQHHTFAEWNTLTFACAYNSGNLTPVACSLHPFSRYKKPFPAWLSAAFLRRSMILLGREGSVDVANDMIFCPNFLPRSWQGKDTVSTDQIFGLRPQNAFHESVAQTTSVSSPCRSFFLAWVWVFVASQVHGKLTRRCILSIIKDNVQSDRQPEWEHGDGARHQPGWFVDGSAVLLAPGLRCQF